MIFANGSLFYSHNIASNISRDCPLTVSQTNFPLSGADLLGIDRSVARRVNLCNGHKRSKQHSTPHSYSLDRLRSTFRNCIPLPTVCRSRSISTIPSQAAEVGGRSNTFKRHQPRADRMSPDFAAPITGNVGTHFILRCRCSRSNAVPLATEEGNNFVAWQCTLERIDRLLHLTYSDSIYSSFNSVRANIASVSYELNLLPLQLQKLVSIAKQEAQRHQSWDCSKELRLRVAIQNQPQHLQTEPPTTKKMSSILTTPKLQPRPRWGRASNSTEPARAMKRWPYSPTSTTSTKKSIPQK